VSQPVPRPRAILFDWDNTLVETWPVIHEALCRTFEAMGVPPWTLAQTRARVRRSMRERFPEMFGDRWTEARDIFYAAYAELHLSRLVAAEGAAEMLAALDEAGLYLGVVSNKTGRYLRSEARHLGWEARFGRLVGAGDAPRDKPAPDPVALALDGSGVAPGAAVWMVGDTDIDMEIAHATGLVPVLIGGDAAAEGDEFTAHPPRFRVVDCAALVSLINGL